MMIEQEILDLIEKRNVSGLSVLLSRIEKQYRAITRFRRQKPLLNNAKFKVVSDYEVYSLGECRAILWNLIEMANKDNLVEIIETSTYNELNKFVRVEARQVVEVMIKKVDNITHSSFYKDLSEEEMDSVNEYRCSLDNFLNSVALDYMSYSEGIELCLPTEFRDSVDLKADRLISIIDQDYQEASRREA